MRLGIFAAVKIKKGHEITYDYAFQYDFTEYVRGARAHFPSQERSL
jgi:SET domain-containing protein